MSALREIVRTCSNAHVARAALASIGGDFEQRFAGEAARRDVSSGALAARMVRAFAVTAGAIDRAAVAAVARGSDQPVLAGLRYILDLGLRMEAERNDPLPPEETPPAWAISAWRAAYCTE